MDIYNKIQIWGNITLMVNKVQIFGNIVIQMVNEL